MTALLRVLHKLSARSVGVTANDYLTGLSLGGAVGAGAGSLVGSGANTLRGKHSFYVRDRVAREFEKTMGGHGPAAAGGATSSRKRLHGKVTRATQRSTDKSMWYGAAAGGPLGALAGMLAVRRAHKRADAEAAAARDRAQTKTASSVIPRPTHLVKAAAKYKNVRDLRYSGVNSPHARSIRGLQAGTQEGAAEYLDPLAESLERKYRNRKLKNYRVTGKVRVGEDGTYGVHARGRRMTPKEIVHAHDEMREERSSEAGRATPHALYHILGASLGGAAGAAAAKHTSYGMLSGPMSRRARGGVAGAALGAGIGHITGKAVNHTRASLSAMRAISKAEYGIKVKRGKR